jgi:hypothetical protein
MRAHSSRCPGLDRAAAAHAPPWACCCRYEDYLDSQITGNDMYFLEDIDVARQLVELG